MKRHALRVLLVLGLLAVGGVLAVLIIGPKVEHRLVRKPLPPAQVAPAISCPGDQATMNCVLQNQAPPLSTAKTLSAPSPSSSIAVGSASGTVTASRSAATSIYGVDFGWSGLSALALGQIHARFAASYFGDDISKNWSAAAVAADHAAGIATVGVFEDSATRAEEGSAAGAADARTAESEAAALGNTSQTIFFAVDCDCAVSALTSYFEGVHSVLGSRTGAYGGYNQVLGLYKLHLVGKINWQTYAWSGGLWLPASIAPLEQYLNGSAYDNDRAVAADYGQWPFAAVKHTGGGRRHWTWLPDTRRAITIPAPSPVWGASRKTHARERHAIRLWDRDRCLNPVKRRVCREDRQHMQLLAGRLSFIAHHTGRHLHHKAKKPRWNAVHYRAPHHKTTLGGAYRQLHRRLVKPGRVTAW